MTSAANEPRWFVQEAPSGNVAFWGVPDTDAVGFTVSCTSGSNVILSPALYAMSEPTGSQKIRFTVDDDTYVRDALLVFSERDAAWRATAVVSTEDEVLTALKRGSTVTYDFDPPLREGDAFTVSLKGSGDAINKVIDGC
ncbi:hypothetical protein DLJ53_23215 [Acuticoccus sediminis]|uniref:Uncharacterized protein n=1 Tax=Acuticoccus sediminis TaxID=2184697 RepID=A0A8B2NIS8_9HYPH|nr:hypothetical protein [Acuticoccus sediminis]RAH99434.1 hypothetical protein DLJ53_23215 [Acuticoccus sediminis]